MRKLVFLLMLVPVFVSAQDVVKFGGKIQNPNSDSITITGKDFTKTIKVKKDGTFSDSFSVAPAIYQFYDGGEYTTLFLKNGFDLFMTLNTAEFDESIVYKGKGEKENNFLAKKALQDEELQKKAMALRENPEEGVKLLRSHFDEIKKAMTDPAMDPGLKIAYDAKMKEDYEKNQANREKREQAKLEVEKLNGTAAPDFEYENHKGGKSKLSELRGKYVYIDVWATWCAPCRAEIPFLKTVEHDFEGKNIEFVSISIDRLKDYDKWRAMVKDQSLGGMQLFADKDWKSDFVQAMKITSIPRFLLIGPDGTIIDADAERPSMPDLKTRLQSLVK